MCSSEGAREEAAQSDKERLDAKGVLGRLGNKELICSTVQVVAGRGAALGAMQLQSSMSPLSYHDLDEM